jgi:hypothetical protein
MCEFEKNILQLLKEEKERLSAVVMDNKLPYIKSLEHGILTAEKKLAECECKANRSLDQSYGFSRFPMDYFKCMQLK